MAIGDNIKLTRKSQRMTRRKLGRKAGVNYRTLENIEMNRSRNPGVYIVQKIAKTLKVPVDALLYEGSSAEGVNVFIPGEVYKVIADAKTQRLLTLMKETRVKELEKVSDFLLSLGTPPKK